MNQKDEAFSHLLRQRARIQALQHAENHTKEDIQHLIDDFVAQAQEASPSLSETEKTYILRLIKDSKFQLPKSEGGHMRKVLFGAARVIES